VGGAVSRTPASAGSTSARPRVLRARFRAVSAGPVAPLLTAGRALTEPFRPLVASCRLSSTDPPAPAGCQLRPERPGLPPRTPVRVNVRTCPRRLPSSSFSALTGLPRRSRPKLCSALDCLAQSSAHPVCRLLTPAFRVSGRSVGFRLDPRLSSVSQRCVRLDFCFPLPSIEHPRLVRSR